jgi:hypothetical protein
MDSHGIYGAEMANMGPQYPQSEAGENLSDAPAIPKGDKDARDALTGEIIQRQTMNTKVMQAIRVVKEYCAIGQ